MAKLPAKTFIELYIVTLSEFSDDVITPPPNNGAQDLHETLLHWRCDIPGLSNQLGLTHGKPSKNSLAKLKDTTRRTSYKV